MKGRAKDVVTPACEKIASVHDNCTRLREREQRMIENEREDEY